MMLRVQRERMSGGFFPTRPRVHRRLRPDPSAARRARRANPDASSATPGPMNRGLEIAADAADAAQSLSSTRSPPGWRVRMAVLYHLLAGEPSEGAPRMSRRC